MGAGPPEETASFWQACFAAGSGARREQRGTRSDWKALGTGRRAKPGLCQPPATDRQERGWGAPGAARGELLVRPGEHGGALGPALGSVKYSSFGSREEGESGGGGRAPHA